MLRYLNFVAQTRQINGGFHLNEYEVRLLDLLASMLHSNQAAFIKDLTAQRNIASRATLHAAVKKLITKKLIRIKSNEEDGRVREVLLTNKALDRYSQLRHAMQ
jgi:DNA-binding MarR family transcriptional regulator